MPTTASPPGPARACCSTTASASRRCPKGSWSTRSSRVSAAPAPDRRPPSRAAWASFPKRLYQQVRRRFCRCSRHRVGKGREPRRQVMERMQSGKRPRAIEAVREDAGGRLAVNAGMLVLLATLGVALLVVGTITLLFVLTLPALSIGG